MRGCLECWCVWELQCAGLRELRSQLLDDGAGKFNLWKSLWGFSPHPSQKWYWLFHLFVDDSWLPSSPYHPIILQNSVPQTVLSVEKPFTGCIYSSVKWYHSESEILVVLKSVVSLSWPSQRLNFTLQTSLSLVSPPFVWDHMSCKHRKVIVLSLLLIRQI